MRNNINHKFKGFTLIELVMVIIIVTILAIISLPKFINLRNTSIEKSEDYIIGAMRAAVAAYNASYIASGGNVSSGYPNVCPLSLLTPPVKIKVYTNYWDNCQPDGVSWQLNSWADAYYIQCPHWDGKSGFSDPAFASKGRYYIYLYGQNPAPYDQWWQIPVGSGNSAKPGDFWILTNLSH